MADEATQQVVANVYTRLVRGEKQSVIRNSLVYAGMTPGRADEMIAIVQQYRRRASRIAGLKMLGVGILVLAGGLFVTLGTYAAARPGGTYIATTGLLGVGIVLTAFGFLRALTGWNFDLQLPDWMEPLAKPFAILIVVLVVLWLANRP